MLIRIRSVRCDLLIVASLMLTMTACANQPHGAGRASESPEVTGRPLPSSVPTPDDVRPEIVQTAPPVAPKNKLSESYTLKVTGMSCRFVCVREVIAALRAVEGVTNVIIDYDEHKAICHCVLGTNPDDLLAALQASGKYSGLVLPQ